MRKSKFELDFDRSERKFFGAFGAMAIFALAANIAIIAAIAYAIVWVVKQLS